MVECENRNVIAKCAKVNNIVKFNHTALMDSVTSLRTKGINKAESPAQPTVEPLSGRMINCKPATVADTAVVDPGLSASNYTYKVMEWIIIIKG